MSFDHAHQSKGKLKYFSKEVNPKCHCCDELAKKFDLYKEAAEKKYDTIVDILAEHKVLLDRIVNQNAAVSNMISIFPITSEEKLQELDAILATQADPYIRQIKLLLSGNAERNLHEVFGSDIIMKYNVDGSFGKKRLKNFGNVLTAIIDAISTITDTPDKTLRAAFQRQKNKLFKQASRSKAKTVDLANKENSYKE